MDDSANEDDDETSEDDDVVVNDDEYNNEDGIGDDEDLQDEDLRTDDKRFLNPLLTKIIIDFTKRVEYLHCTNIRGHRIISNYYII